MSSFALAWVLMSCNFSCSTTNYSPPVESLVDCQRMQDSVRNLTGNRVQSQCIQINALKGGR